MTSQPRTRRLARLLRNRLAFGLWTWRRLPLAAFAGLRVVSLDEDRAIVLLPGGWRTRNPFRSAYFAAQAMAAELSTGAPLLVHVEAARASLSTLVTRVEGSFARKLEGAGRFACEDVPAMGRLVSRVAEAGGAETFVARSVGRDVRGEVVSEWAITWSVKRREEP